jgi:hypothetical protein
MKTINVIRCWKNFNEDSFTVLAVFLEKFKQKFNFNITLCITHRQDTNTIVRIKKYIENFNIANNSNHSLHFVDREVLENFLKDTYGFDTTVIDRLNNQPVLYNIVLSFYMRKIHNLSYVLFHDDDILYTVAEIPEVNTLLEQEECFGIQHPYSFSDLSLVGKLTLLFQKDVFTPYSNKGLAATNTGFMGINLECLDIFSKDHIIKLFTEVLNYDSFDDTVKTPHFMDGAFSFNLYSQEQSFFSLLSRARSKTFTILDNNLGHQIFLDIEELQKYNPKIHHYVYALKYSDYFRQFLDYYQSKIDRKVNLFLPG